MRIEDVVESLNQYIEDIRKSKLLEAKSFLVLKKHIEPSEHFKAYKVAIVEIFVVNGPTNYILTTHSYQGRLVSSQEEEVLLDLERQVVKTLFGIVNTDIFDKIVKGEYNEDTIEN